MTAPTEHPSGLAQGAIPQQGARTGPPGSPGTAAAQTLAPAAQAPTAGDPAAMTPVVVEPAPAADPVADRAAVRAFRPRRAVAATVAAIALTALGTVVAVETISALVSRPVRWLPYDRMLAWASTTLWQNPWVLTGAALLALLGLALIALALAPGRPRLVPVRTGDADLIIGVRPKSFARALGRAAQDVPGVHSARAQVHGTNGGTVAVTATTSGWDDTRLAEAVRQAVAARIDTMGPVGDYRIEVKLKGT